jgi:hypothetical protein
MNLTLRRKEVNCYWPMVMSGRDQVGSRIGDFRLMMEARGNFNSHLSLGRPADRHRLSAREGNGEKELNGN